MPQREVNRQPSQQEILTSIQNQLNAMGFTDNNGNKLRADGIMGTSTAEAIMKLQRFLNENGYRDAQGNELRVDGSMREATRRAFESYEGRVLFQITVQGMESMTPAQLGSLAQTVSQSAPVVNENASTQNIRHVQNILIKLHVTDDQGNVLEEATGRYDDWTKQAIANLQRYLNYYTVEGATRQETPLPIDGQFGANTIGQLAERLRAERNFLEHGTGFME
jgi:peptidoglycan hydrolase-like protein with peptidoglycan-binding domain